MHGFIVSEIKKYALAELGEATWLDILKQAGAGSGEFVNYREYPDEEVVALVGAAAEVTGLEPAAILEDFGLFLAADLMRIYRPLVADGWTAIDFLDHTEAAIHHVVRSRNRQARPPALAFERQGEDEILLVYSSPRRMCALARGIALGVGEHYREELAIEEDACMHRGDPDCRMRIRAVG